MESYPLAVGQQLDARESERRLFSDLAEQLWTGNFLMPSAAGLVSQPSNASKARLERDGSDLREVKESKEYAGMALVSKKKTDENALKRKRNQEAEADAMEM